MNFHERLTLAVKKKPLDRPPVICPGGMMTMAVKEAMEKLDCPWPAAHTDARLMARLTLGMVELGGIENLGVPFCMTIEAGEMGATVDLGNLTREPHVTRYAIGTMDAAEGIMPFDPKRGRAGICCEAIRMLKSSHPEIPIIANVTGPVSLATSLVDPLLFYRALRRNTSAAHRLNQLCTDGAICFGEAMIEAGADFICIADPSATGDLLGPAAFQEFCLPYLNRMADHFQQSCNTSTIVHICGNIKGTGRIIAELTAEVISVDSVVAIHKLKKLACTKATMGNVSTFILEKGTPEKVSSAAGICLNQGVNILAPACGISPLTPLKNIRSMTEATRNWRHPAPTPVN